MQFRVYLVVISCLLAACAPLQMQGVNMLQSSTVSLDDLRNVENMQHLRGLGANTVAIVSFIRQSAKNSCDLEVDQYYSDERLRLAIRNARLAGLKVVLKPQMLVTGSWAGEIEADSEAGWKCWFSAYHKIMLDYAKLSEDTGVTLLVVGTELVKTELRPEWKELVAALRVNYTGQLSYVGDSLQGALRFSAFEQLDSIAISFYPGNNDGLDMGIAGDRLQMRSWMQRMAEDMKQSVKLIGKPFWFAEVGITSRKGALKDPWQWVEALPQPRVIDLGLQAEVLDGWLSALKGNWHQGILIWNWFSDPKAGGDENVDFTIQNKPALKSVSCHWLGVC